MDYNDALEKYLNEGINYGANTIANADVEDLKQLASDSFHAGYLVSKLELQKQKELNAELVKRIEKLTPKTSDSYIDNLTRKYGI